MLRELETKVLNTQLDVADRLATSMYIAGIDSAALALKADVPVDLIKNILCGDGNPTVEQLVRLFDAMGRRFDLVISASTVNEWHVKRQIQSLERRFNPPH